MIYPTIAILVVLRWILGQVTTNLHLLERRRELDSKDNKQISPTGYRLLRLLQRNKNSRAYILRDTRKKKPS